MPALDKFHATVKNALTKDGWTINAEPLRLDYGGMEYFVDFGAEKLIAAEKDNQKIAVEVKSFLSDSFTYEFHQVVGQFVDYRLMLTKVEPERMLYVAVPVNIYQSSFQIPFVRMVTEELHMNLLVYNIADEAIETWIN